MKPPVRFVSLAIGKSLQAFPQTSVRHTHCARAKRQPDPLRFRPSLEGGIAMMKLSILRMRKLAATLFAVALLSAIVFSVGAQGTDPDPNDSAAYYKAKCVACHGQKADKRFDVTLTEEQLVGAILKGKKPEKPPNMPAYEAKGINADQAKALVTYMKQLKDVPAGN